MKYRIVSSQIRVQWNDNPKLEVVMNEMPSDLEEAFGQWLSDIEHERNQGETE